LPSLAEELIRLNPDVILAPASGPAVAAKKATATIPIVTPALADAVHLGLIASDSRPGGNVTGITPYVAGLPAKQMELAREVVPSAARIRVLANLSDPKAPPQWQELEAAGRELGVNVVAEDDPTPPATARLPAIYGYREHVDDGGLVSYGVDLRACFRRGAYYVHKILKGVPPCDLPVEFPTKLELVINLETAKALGLERRHDTMQGTRLGVGNAATRSLPSREARTRDRGTLGELLL